MLRPHFKLPKKAPASKYISTASTNAFENRLHADERCLLGTFMNMGVDVVASGVGVGLADPEGIPEYPWY